MAREWSQQLVFASRQVKISCVLELPFRYLAVSREEPKAALPGGVTVVTDLTIVNEKDPIPHGFVAIDYTVDTREKALRLVVLLLRSTATSGRNSFA